MLLCCKSQAELRSLQDLFKQQRASLSAFADPGKYSPSERQTFHVLKSHFRSSFTRKSEVSKREASHKSKILGTRRQWHLHAYKRHLDSPNQYLSDFAHFASHKLDQESEKGTFSASSPRRQFQILFLGAEHGKRDFFQRTISLLDVSTRVGVLDEVERQGDGGHSAEEDDEEAEHELPAGAPPTPRGALLLLLLHQGAVVLLLSPANQPISASTYRSTFGFFVQVRKITTARCFVQEA